MQRSPSSGIGPLRGLSWVLIAAAVGLLIVHFVLDSGPDKEAPAWIIWTAAATGFAAAIAGYLHQRSRH
jgi:hypothetical protein